MTGDHPWAHLGLSNAMCVALLTLSGAGCCAALEPEADRLAAVEQSRSTGEQVPVRAPAQCRDPAYTHHARKVEAGRRGEETVTVGEL